MTQIIRVLLVACAVALGPALARAEVVFAPEAVLAIGKDSAEVVVFVRVNEQPLAGLELLSIEDVGAVGGGSAPADELVFGDLSKVAAADTSAEWRSTLHVKGLKPGALFERNAKLTFRAAGGEGATASTTRAARYKLTTRLPSVAWSVSQVGESLVSPTNNELEITVLSTDATAHHLRIESNSLREGSTGFRIQPGWLKLCDKKTSPKCAPDEVPAGTRVPLVLRFDGEIPSGVYTGVVNLAIDESAEAKPVTFASFARSNPRDRYLGMGAIALGLLISLLIGTLARNFTSVGRALLPAARLLEFAQRLTSRIAGYEGSAPKTANALKTVLHELSRSTLVANGFVPPLIPSPFGNAPLSASEFSSYLQVRSDRLSALGLLIEQGFDRVATIRSEPNNPAHPAARERAFQQLDALADAKTLSVDELTNKIPPIVAAYEAALKPPVPAGFAPAAAAPPVGVLERPSLAELSVVIDSTSSAVWLLTFAVALVGGHAALIATNPGFGVPNDFIKCFLWGLGLQVAGQQIGQLTASSISASVLKVPT
jgi:hypothetical protein